MSRWSSSLLMVVLLAVAMGACGDTTEPTTPTTPTVIVTKTEKVSGTLAAQETKLHVFVVQPGPVTAKLSAIGPVNTLTIGFAVGTWDGLSCTPVVVNESAGEGNSLTGTASAVTNLCLKVYDTGKVVEPASYTFDVTYPTI